eukprot:COSAG02_NODE_6503_length_3534_cov_2.486463_5_plen_80_part_00
MLRTPEVPIWKWHRRVLLADSARAFSCSVSRQYFRSKLSSSAFRQGIIRLTQMTFRHRGKWLCAAHRFIASFLCLGTES